MSNIISDHNKQEAELHKEIHDEVEAEQSGHNNQEASHNNGAGYVSVIDKVILPALLWFAVALSVFQIWQGVTADISATYFRPIHLCWVIVLIFIKYPIVAPEKPSLYKIFRPIDLLLCVLAIWASYTIIDFDYNSIDHLLNGLQNIDFIAGTVLMLLLLDATRRSVGWVMAIIGIAFLLYAAFGNVLPDEVATRGFTWERIIRTQIFSTIGVFGAPLGIAAGAVFMFILFGAFLEISGAGKFFIDLSFAAAGKYRGGPAKASVVASAAMGSISGSAIANTVTTGSITIPMMNKLGYSKSQATGIEAAASTGGQIMPPIMGAGAFIMAEFTNTKYGDIVMISIMPAILYFVSALIYVHLLACKIGLKGSDDRPSAWQALKEGAHFLVPLIFITIMLLMNYSPVLVGVSGCAAVIVASFIRKHTHMSFHTIITALKNGAMMAAPISAACATAGIVVGVIGQTGIGLQFTEFVLTLADGRLWLAFILISLASLILGMGLPVTAAYIVISVMAAPALQDMGIALITAHMVVFWLSQTSNVTPPIALAAFAGAGVSGAKPMKCAIEAFKLAKGFFIIPFMMIYTDLLWIEDVTLASFIYSAVVTLAVICAIAFAGEGYIMEKASMLERILLALSVILIIYPYYNYYTGGVGLVIFTIAIAMNYVRYHKNTNNQAISGSSAG